MLKTVILFLLSKALICQFSFSLAWKKVSWILFNGKRRGLPSPWGTLPMGWLQLLWQQGEDVMSHNDPVTAMSSSQRGARTASWKFGRHLIKGICSVMTAGFPSSCIQLWKQPDHRTPAPDSQRACISHFRRAQPTAPRGPGSSVRTAINAASINRDREGTSSQRAHWSRHKRKPQGV